MSLLQMTLYGGAFILCIVVIRTLALCRLPKGTFLVLWQMAALRLLLPFTIPLPFRVAPMEHLPVVGKYLEPTDWTSVPESAAVFPHSAPTPTNNATGAVLPIIWLAGAILMAACFTVLYVRAKRRFCTSTPEDNPIVLQWLTAHRLHRPLEVRQSARISSPLTYGILRPVILLPADMAQCNEVAMHHILTHEFVHIRRFDAVTKLLFAAVLCVHWFNPLVWVMYALANRDMELSCDERVMHTLGLSERTAYALTLISMEESRSRYISFCNHFSKLAIEERINTIMKLKKTSIWAMATATVLVIGATAVFATAAQAEDAAPFLNGQNQIFNALYVLKDDTSLSDNLQNSKIYYRSADGKTLVPLTSEQCLTAHKITWWTCDEYAAWLENEKIQLQAMLGEKAWTSGKGDFVWTQEIIDETIAMYESVLQEIKAGMLYSKYVDGDDSVVISGWLSDQMTISEKDLWVSGDDGLWEKDLTGLHPGRSEEEWQQIIADIESGKIPPFEMPDDPNITVSFVDYVDGNCTAND